MSGDAEHQEESVADGDSASESDSRPHRRYTQDDAQQAQRTGGHREYDDGESLPAVNRGQVRAMVLDLREELKEEDRE